LTANPSRALAELVFARMRAEWETLAALVALAPYGPTLRPNRLRLAFKH